MARVFSLDHINLDNTWLTIGIFDGVHLGHQELLKHLVYGAHQENLPAIVLTFDPHPAVVLGGDREFKTLSTPDERASLIEALGVDIVIIQEFNELFANQSADEFMLRLRKTIGVSRLVIGYDTALGRGRKGDANRLSQLGIEMGFSVDVIPAVRVGNQIVKSTAIRSLVMEGDMETAALMLGRPFTITGKVIHGDGRGRRINLPTANIAIPTGKVIPKQGIYATWVWVQGERFRGATNLGVNPTFTPESQKINLETHLLDFNKDLYGQELKIEFITRLREERKYDSVEGLLQQIQLDIQQTRLKLN